MDYVFFVPIILWAIVFLMTVSGVVMLFFSSEADHEHVRKLTAYRPSKTNEGLILVVGILIISIGLISGNILFSLIGLLSMVIVFIIIAPGKKPYSPVLAETKRKIEHRFTMEEVSSFKLWLGWGLLVAGLVFLWRMVPEMNLRNIFPALFIAVGSMHILFPKFVQACAYRPRISGIVSLLICALSLIYYVPHVPNDVNEPGKYIGAIFVMAIFSLLLIFIPGSYLKPYIRWVQYQNYYGGMAKTAHVRCHGFFFVAIGIFIAFVLGSR
jgi:hypothetical protein